LSSTRSLRCRNQIVLNDNKSLVLKPGYDASIRWKNCVARKHAEFTMTIIQARTGQTPRRIASSHQTPTYSYSNCTLDNLSTHTVHNASTILQKLHSYFNNTTPQAHPSIWYHSRCDIVPGTKLTHVQTALFNFQSLLLVLLLSICTATYAHYVFPGIIDRNKENYFVSPIWKAARVGERMSPYVSLACVVMAVSSDSLLRAFLGAEGCGTSCVDVGCCWESIRKGCMQGIRVIVGSKQCTDV
jgi:hypothetical protein